MRRDEPYFLPRREKPLNVGVMNALEGDPGIYSAREALYDVGGVNRTSMMPFACISKDLQCMRLIAVNAAIHLALGSAVIV